jgi:hypothetical protein
VLSYSSAPSLTRRDHVLKAGDVCTVIPVLQIDEGRGLMRGDDEVIALLNEQLTSELTAVNAEQL